MAAPSAGATFAQLLGHLREPLVLATRAGRILAANVAAAEALGTSVEALDGALLEGFCPDPSGLTERLAAVVADAAVAFPLRSRDGRRFSCDATAIDPEILLLRLSGGPAAEPRLLVFNERLARLEGIVAGAFDPQAELEIAHVLRTRVTPSLGAVAVGVFLLDGSAANLELKAWVGYPENYVDRFRLVPLAVSIPLTDAVNRGAPVFLGTAEEYAALYPEFTKTHPEIALRAMACVPLDLDGRTIGVIGLGFPLGKVWSEDDRDLLSDLARHCTQAFERARAEHADRGARNIWEHGASQLARLHAFTGALAQAITWAEVVEAVVDMGMTATSARIGGLWILSEDGATVSLVRSVGQTRATPEAFQNVPLDRPDRMPILDAIRSGTAVWIESCRQMEEQYPAFHRVISRGGESGLACLPLFAQGRCIGGLVFNYEGVHRFLEDERAFLQMLSWYSAQAIERSRLYAAEKRAREVAEANQRRAAFLAHTGTILASSLDYAATLAGVAGAAVPRVADWCIVELDVTEHPGFSPVAAHVDPTKVAFVLDLSRRFRELGHADRGIPGVIRSGSSKLHPSITDADLERGLGADPTLLELYRRTGLASSMVVPMTARGRTLGAILLVSANPARRYDEDDLAMAEELGRRAGVAVDNARLYQNAREADRRKEGFLAILGHELRNPLAPIVTALELMDLRGGETFARERKTIARQVEHVVGLVDDLLDVSRITSGKVRLRKERIEVSQVIARALETASPLLEQRFHELTVSVPVDGLPIFADLGRFSQTIANLLINAAKYTEPRGRVSVTATLEDSEVCIRVRDSGVGIAPESLPTIFELFVQAAASLERAEGGLGIGLAIVKSLVQLHGGSVSAHSAGLGKGSEFVVRLPLADEGLATTPSVQLRGKAPGRGDGVRVLIVDDNRDAALMLSEALEEFGYETHVAHDGPSALTAAPVFVPAIALLDIGLPAMDGYELATRLRRADATTMTRLIAVTGYGEESDRRRSREAGFDEHLVKPLNLETLVDLLTRLEEQGRGTTRESDVF